MERAGTLAADVTAALLAAARALRARPLARRSAAWALEGDDDFAKECAAARDEELRLLIETLRARHQLPRYLDLETVVALLSAASAHLALQADSPAGTAYAGLDLRQDATWRRIERTLAALINSLLSSTEG